MDIKNFEKIYGLSYFEALKIVKSGNISLIDRYERACRAAQIIETKKYLEDNFGCKETLNSGKSYVFTLPSISKKIKHTNEYLAGRVSRDYMLES